MQRTLQQQLISRVAELLVDTQHVAVGASSPIPAAGALLAQHRNPKLRISLLGSESHTAFTDGGKELFDCAAQGRIDAFFLSGVQIDGEANINLVGTGEYPLMNQRFSGSFGSAYLYHIIPKIILFCWAHSARSLVENVDFISAAGPRNDGVWRTGGPTTLLTDRCEFSYHRKEGNFELIGIHPGESLESIQSNTGFNFIEDTPQLTESPQPTGQLIEILDSSVLPQLGKTYPRFVDRYFSHGDG